MLEACAFCSLGSASFDSKKGQFMNLLIFLVFGLIVGVVARMIVPGRESGGWPTSLAIGVLGSYLGGYLGPMLGFHGGGRPAGFLMSLLGAIGLLVVYHAVQRRPRSA